MLINPATSSDEAERNSDVAVLPVGSFEQHGPHLPLATDALIATAIAQRVGADYDLRVLPTVPLGCSHEHAAFPGTVSISSATLTAVVRDVMTSLERSGTSRLVLVNAHGGNYVLSNVVQEANVCARRAALFPSTAVWNIARQHAGCETDAHRDMHAGEAETSILLHEAPELVGADYQSVDHLADERPHLLSTGVSEYSSTGVIGLPSAATSEKGRLLLDSLSGQFKGYLAILRG